MPGPIPGGQVIIQTIEVRRPRLLPDQANKEIVEQKRDRIGNGQGNLLQAQVDAKLDQLIGLFGALLAIGLACAGLKHHARRQHTRENSFGSKQFFCH